MVSCTRLTQASWVIVDIKRETGLVTGIDWSVKINDNKKYKEKRRKRKTW